MQWTGYGTSNTSAKYWINGKQVFHVTGLDLRTLKQDGSNKGVGQFEWNNFYNGTYVGSTVASRLEDNMVVTNGAPVSCEDIGFNGISDPDPGEGPPPPPPLAAPNFFE